MLTIAKQRMKETMEELEQANSAVEIAMKKVGPAAGLASDVTMLLELLKRHMTSLSMNAADIIAIIEGDVKVVRIRETRFKECASGEMPPGIQLTQLDMPRIEAQEMASQLQAVEAVRQVEEEEEEKAKRARIDAGKSTNICSLTESLNNAANSIKDQKPETPMKSASSSSSSAHASKESSKAVEKPNDKRGHRGGMQWSDGNTHASCRDRLERTRRDSENKHCKSGTRPLQAVLKKCGKAMKAEGEQVCCRAHERIKARQANETSAR